MTTGSKTLIERAAILADFLGDDFITLARHLRELHEERPDIVFKVAELAGIGRRKAYALVRISKQFDNLKISEQRLHKIGWTRLQLIGRYLQPENVHALLTLAEKNTVHDLDLLLRGEEPVENARVVLLYLPPEDYQKLEKCLVSFGAAPYGNGLIGKEAALMQMLTAFPET